MLLPENTEFVVCQCWKDIDVSRHNKIKGSAASCRKWFRPLSWLTINKFKNMWRTVHIFGCSQQP